MQKLFYEYQEKWYRFVGRVRHGVLRCLEYSTYPFEIIMEWAEWITRVIGGGIIRKLTYPIIAFAYWLRPAPKENETSVLWNTAKVPLELVENGMDNLAEQSRRLSILRTVFAYLQMPFEWLGHSALRVFDWVVQAKLFQWLMYGFDAITDMLGMIVQRIGLILFDNPVAQVLIPRWLVYEPNGEVRDFAYPIRSIAEFTSAWLHTRNARTLLGGLPAALLLLAASLLVARLSLATSNDIAADYRNMARESLENDDLLTLQLCNQKLAQLGVTTEHSEFSAALKLDESGHFDEAVAKMRSLATASAQGYAPAHLWLAAKLVQDEISMPRTKQLELAKQHLNWHDETHPESQTAQVLWAQIYAESGDTNNAYEKMADLVDSYPELAYDMFVVSLQAGNTELARRDAMNLKQHLETPGHDQIDVDQCFRMAQAHEILGDLTSARKVVANGRKKWPDDLRLRMLAGKFAIIEYDRIRSIGSATVEQRMKFLHEAFDSGEVDEEVAKRLAALYQNRGKSKAALETVRRLVSDSKSPAMVFFQFGTQAAVDGDKFVARKLLQRSLKLNPDDSSTLNNVAWLMANTDPKDLDAAIKFANKALLYDPNNYHFRETRGQIHLARQEWQLAIQDLEYALPRMGPEKRKPIRKSLEAAYEELNRVPTSR